MRPTVHFTPASGWINDPHGITVVEGQYRAFFQYVPGHTTWAPNCHWGRATGNDLLSLREENVAIAPGDGDDGIWTGCIVVDGDDVRAFYTAVSTPDFGIGRVGVARPVDAEWASWQKGEVVVTAPPELDLIAFRDPSIRRDGDGWRMFVGAAGRDGRALALTYTSSDLVTWSYDGIALERHTSERNPVWTGALWECPQVFSLGDRDFLVSSIWEADELHYAAYAVGALRDGRLTDAEWARLTWGPSLYAPSLFTDADGRLALTFWLRGISGDGWAGAHSVPYLLEAVSGRLIARPHPDVTSHRAAASSDGTIDSLAADVVWQADAGTLTISSGSPDAVPVAVLEVGEGQAIVTTPTSRDLLPVRGEIRALIDGPILEISSETGIFATAIAPTGSGLSITATAGALDVYRLV